MKNVFFWSDLLPGDVIVTERTAELMLLSFEMVMYLLNPQLSKGYHWLNASFCNDCRCPRKVVDEA